MSATNGSPLLAELAFIFFAAAAISAGLIVMLRPLLLRHALARPNARSSHKVPTPQGGGIAVVTAAIAVAAAVCLTRFAAGADLTAFWIVSAAAIMMACLGAADDFFTIPVVPRLVIQFALVGAVIATLPADFRILDLLPWWLERLLWLVALVWFVNLANFMDGIDLMTAAETVPVAGALALLGYAAGLPSYAVVMAAALSGAVVGFVPFNRPVAKLFLGDVGSLPIGLLLAWLLAVLASRGHLPAAVLLPLYYLADATLTLAQRILRRERIWEAHRDHFYQRAADSGSAVGGIVAMVFVVNLLLAGLAAMTVWADSRLVDYAALAVGILSVSGLLTIFARGKR